MNAIDDIVTDTIILNLVPTFEKMWVAYRYPDKMTDDDKLQNNWAICRSSSYLYVALPHLLQDFLTLLLVVLFYDYALTLSNEIRNIWPSKVTAATIIFYVNRYISLIGYAVILYFHFMVPNKQAVSLYLLSHRVSKCTHVHLLQLYVWALLDA